MELEKPLLPEDPSLFLTPHSPSNKDENAVSVTLINLHHLNYLLLKVNNLAGKMVRRADFPNTQTCHCHVPQNHRKSFPNISDFVNSNESMFQNIVDKDILDPCDKPPSWNLCEKVKNDKLQGIIFNNAEMEAPIDQETFLMIPSQCRGKIQEIIEIEQQRQKYYTKAYRLFSICEIVKDLKKIALNQQETNQLLKNVENPQIPLDERMDRTEKKSRNQFPSLKEIELIISKNQSKKKFPSKLKLLYVEQYFSNPNQDNIASIINSLGIDEKTFLNWIKKHQLELKGKRLVKEIKNEFQLKKELQFKRNNLGYNGSQEMKVYATPKLTLKEFKEIAKRVYVNKHFGLVDKWCQSFIIKNNLQQICQYRL